MEQAAAEFEARLAKPLFFWIISRIYRTRASPAK
jgi:hypothetical protein